MESIINHFNFISGGYLPLTGLDEENTDNLVRMGVVNRPSQEMKSAGMARDWPLNRGLYYNANDDTFVCLNNRDHVHLCAKQEGADIQGAYFRYCKAMNEIRSQLKFDGHEFMYSERLGYISTCPSDLGTGMRASVHIKLPALCENRDYLDSLCDAYKLQVRGTGGIDTPIEDNICDISNIERLGVGENDLIINVSIRSHILEMIETI